MADTHKTVVRSAGQFALHHWTPLALLVLGLGLFAFIAIADEVVEGDTMQLDRSLLLALRAAGDRLGPDWGEELFRDFTALGGAAVVGLLTLFSIGYLWLRKLRRLAVFVLVAIGGGLLLSLALKNGFDRPRPDLVPHGSFIYTSSFPSGHSMLSAVVYLTGGGLLGVMQRARSVRIYLVGCSVLVTLLVGISRVYLGVHWPSDVLAGWAAGAAWAAACWLVAVWLQERGLIEQRVVGHGDEAAVTRSAGQPDTR
ncbi:MAG: phosphatase PAP2 family protein [Thiogranum sp.]